MNNKKKTQDQSLTEAWKLKSMRLEESLRQTETKTKLLRADIGIALEHLEDAVSILKQALENSK